MPSNTSGDTRLPPVTVPDNPDVVTLTASDRQALYGVRRYIGSGLEKKLKVRIPFDVYFQDPLVAEANPTLAFDENCLVPWEPGLADGPTSARFAVVDYDGHTETLAAPARWDKRRDRFLDPDGKPLDRSNTKPLQFHQVNVWAIVQRALDFFENGSGLGRSISWGFEGSRLIIVPHAGFGENAYYDRRSKSLQFYYFDRGDERVHTCLSTDIVHHEFGHAVLDGVRPYFIEAVSPETAAFHEFIGDLTAILIAFRNTPFRQQLIEETQGDLTKESTLSKVAEQFGKYVKDKEYLRSARNKLTMKDVAGDQRPHYMSEVLTGAMFDILIRLSKYYVTKRKRTVPQAFWDTIQRMQQMAIQPLDLLPPVDVTFRDYALAVLRAEEIANPTDPDDYREMMIDVFIDRGILDKAERAGLLEPHQVFERLDLDVFHDIGSISSSRADAYRFLDDNRRKLFIPANADVLVSDLSTAQKLTREARRLPRQILLQYMWREDVVLDGPEFGRFDGETTSLLCGGTLALNQNGELLAWSRKPGSQSTGESDEASAEQAQGVARRTAFLAALARRIKTGRIGAEIGGEKGLLVKSIPPLTSRTVDGAVRFELSPHFGIHEDEDDTYGGRAWQISS
jgi:hypothetical protein